MEIRGNSGFINVDKRFGSITGNTKGVVSREQHFLERVDGRYRPSGDLSPGGTPTAWYDANDSYITLNTGNVSGWVDRSGNGLNLPDSGVSTRPVYVSSDSNFNSLPSVDFQADDNLESPSNVLLNSADGFTVYIVTKINSFPSSFNFLLGRINGTTLTQGSDLSVNTLMLNEKYIKYGIEDLSSDGVDGIYDWLNGVGSFTQDGFPSKSYYNETYKNGIIDILNGVQ